MRLRINHKILLVLAVAAGLVGLMLSQIVLPVLTDIAAIRSAIYKERVGLEKNYQRGQLLRKTLRDFETVKPSRDQLSTALLAAGAELELVGELETLASTHQLEQRVELQPNAERISPDISALRLVITLQGPFSSTMEYLEALERLPMFIRLDLVTFSAAPSSRSNAARAIQARLEGVVPILEPTKN